MRHGNRIKKLGRTAAHRKATLQALSMALLRHKRITTTLPKAKALRSYVEPIINRAKDDSTHSRRQAFRYLQDKEAVKTLFGEVAESLGDRPGGYTRVVKLGQRPGDAAEMAIIELVDFNDVKPDGSGGSKRKTRRSRSRSRGGAAAAATAPKEAAAEAPAEEAASESDDLTKLKGIGPVMAGALSEAGITTYAALAEADLDTLRTIIDEGTNTSAGSANEETWAEQARFAAAGDWDGLEAYLSEGDAPADEPEAAADEAPVEEAPVEEASADPEAEAVVSDAANPETTGNPQVPPTAEGGEHGDLEQGVAPGTGEPNPDASAENQGRSGDHR